MTVTTKFDRGDQVVNVNTGKVFIVGDIRVKVWEYRGREMLNIDYREAKPSIDPKFPNLRITGPWVAEVDVCQ